MPYGIPNPDEIRSGLAEIANNWRVLAVFWHAYFAMLAGMFFVPRRLSRRTFGVLLSVPLASVSALAWVVGNFFNGADFAIACLSLVAIAVRLPKSQIELMPWGAVPGTLMFAFGWVYPHFLTTASYSTYLYFAPTGLLPCPTLSIVVGLALATSGLRSIAWSMVAGSTALFYGVYGAAVLSVALDWTLVVGAVLLLVIGIPRGQRGPMNAFLSRRQTHVKDRMLVEKFEAPY